MKRFASESAKMCHFFVLIGSGCRFGKFVRCSLPGIILLVMLAVNMPSEAGEKKTRAQLQVGAVVLTVLKIKVASQHSQINIEQKHVHQGYIDVEDASVLLITSNSPNGFMMSLTHNPDLVSGVSARLSQGMSTSNGENIIPVRTQQVMDEPMRISYRLYLNPQAHVGSLPWPVALSFTPRAV